MSTGRLSLIENIYLNLYIKLWWCPLSLLYKQILANFVRTANSWSRNRTMINISICYLCYWQRPKSTLGNRSNFKERFVQNQETGWSYSLLNSLISTQFFIINSTLQATFFLSIVFGEILVTSRISGKIYSRNSAVLRGFHSSNIIGASLLYIS